MLFVITCLWFLLLTNHAIAAVDGDQLAMPTTCQEVPISQAIKPDSQGKYLIFVSFSMPSSSLQALYQAANTQNGVLLLRGLKNGSFKQTAEAIRALAIGVQINPQAFTKYQITKVPTIVLVHNNCFKSLSGNVTFAYAQAKLLESQ